MFYKNMACIRLTPTEVGCVLGVAKFTPGVNDIRYGCHQTVTKIGKENEQKIRDRWQKS